MMDLAQGVLEFLQRQEDPVGLDTLLKGLGLFSADRALLRTVLRDMAREGRITRTGSRYWLPDGRRRGLAIKRGKHGAPTKLGRLSLHPRGFGFVSFPGGGQDWFIPAEDMGLARHGDLVRVERSAGAQSGRSSGRIVSIEQMERTTLVGVLERRRGGQVFLPFGQPAISSDLLSGLPVELTEDSVLFLSREASGRFRFRGILGSLADGRIDDRLVLAEQGISLEFPAEVVEAAAGFARDYAFPLGKREDFRSMRVFTIDGVDARDFDDALHLGFHGEEIELGVHIADVSHFVPSGSVLDRWARSAGNSTYLPHRAWPMLPERLSSELCSLKPGEDRYTLSVLMTLTRKGDLRSYRICRGLIRSRFRLSYDQVQAAIIDRNPELRLELQEIIPDLEQAMQLATVLKKKRRKAGGLDLDMAEPLLALDEDHFLQSIGARRMAESNQLIEMFMVLTNEVVARHMRQAGLGIPYRHHGPPDRDRLLHLLTLLQAKGMKVPVFPNAREGNDGQLLNALLSQITELPQVEADIWQTALLKCLKLAEYDAQQPDHFGLASSCYCHFTSPIRRYADLLLHQRLGALLDDPHLGPEHFNDEELPLICEALSRSERASSRAERHFVEMKLLRHLQGRLGETLPGVISDVQPFGLFVRLEELWVDGLLREDRLDGQSYEFNRDLMCWTGRKNGRVFRLGDRIQVHLDRVDLLRRELELSLPNASRSSLHSGGWRDPGPAAGAGRTAGTREQGRSRQGGFREGPSRAGAATSPGARGGAGRQAKGRSLQRRKKR